MPHYFPSAYANISGVILEFPFFLKTYTNMWGNLLSLTSKHIQNPNILHYLWSKLIPRTTTLSQLISILVFLSVRLYSQHKSQSFLKTPSELTPIEARSAEREGKGASLGKGESWATIESPKRLFYPTEISEMAMVLLSGLKVVGSSRVFSSPLTTRWL